MLSRGSTSAGAVGSSNAVCGAKRARPSVAEIVALQQQRLVRLHLRHVEPAMRRVVVHAIGLADAVLVHQVGWHQVLRRHRGRVAHRKRGVAQRAADRPPQVDHLHAPPQQRLGLVAEEVAHPLWPRRRRVVYMHAGRRLAWRAGRPVLRAAHALAQRVVEDEHLAGARRLGENTLDLGVVHPAHLVFVPEILHRARCVQHREPLAIQRNVRGGRAHIVDRHGVLLALHVRPRHPRRRFERVVARAFRHRGQVIQRRLDVRQMVSPVRVHCFGSSSRCCFSRVAASARTAC